LGGYYDYISSNTSDRGLAILHHKSLYNGLNSLKLVSSDGFWKWNKINDVTHPFGSGTWHRLERRRPNIEVSDAGYVGSHRDAFINPSGSKKQWAGVALNYLPNFDAHMSEINALSDGYGYYYTSAFYQGWSFKSSFDHVDRNRWSPFTNPSTRAWDGSQTGLDIQITGKTGSTLDLVINRSVSSSQISSNLTWKNLITLTENLTVKNGATLTIDPGTWVSVDDDVTITVEAGGRIVANGTQSEPIRFTSMWDSGEWNGLKLNGDFNVFAWTIFAEADTAISVRSKENYIQNCIIEKGNVGLHIKGKSTYTYEPSAFLSDILINDMASEGMIVRNVVDMSLEQSTVRDVDGVAIRWINSDYDNGVFRYNLITSNWATSSVPSVVVESAGVFRMPTPNHSSGGNNRLVGNNGVPITIDATSYLYAGYRILDGMGNEIYKEEGDNVITRPVSGYRIDNWSSNWAHASYNYWASNPPSLSYFSWKTEYSAWLTCDPHMSCGSVDVGVDEVGDLPDPDEIYEHKYVVPLLVEHNDSEGWEQLHAAFRTLRSQAENGIDVFTKIYHPIQTLARRMSQEEWDWSLHYLESILPADPYSKNNAGEEVPQWVAAAQLRVNMYKKRVSMAGVPSVALTYVVRMAEQGWGLESYPLLLAYEGLPSLAGHDTDGWKREYQRLLTEEKPESARYSWWGNADHIDPGKVATTSESDNEASSDSGGLNVFPNPFNPTTRIEYRIPKEAMVTVEVYGIDGRRVRMLHNGRLTPGSYGHTLDASDLATGIYLVRLSIDGALHTRKITLIK